MSNSDKAHDLALMCTRIFYDRAVKSDDSYIKEPFSDVISELVDTYERAFDQIIDEINHDF